MSERGRYMTPADKARVLVCWRETQQERMRPAGDPGGHGYVDPEILPWCDRVNAIAGAVTLQSCAGHRMPAFDDPEAECVYNAELWIWMSRPLAVQVYEAMDDLSTCDLIDGVSLLFNRHENREILSVQAVPERRDAAMRFVCGFLERAQDRAWG